LPLVSLLTGGIWGAIRPEILVTFFGFNKLFDKIVGVIIDSNGIADNTNMTSIGLIEWNDISAIRTKRVMSTKFLLIDVVNPEKYIRKVKNKIQSQLMKTNLRDYDTPLSITTNTLKYNLKKLEKLIQTEFNKNKNNT